MLVLDVLNSNVESEFSNCPSIIIMSHISHIGSKMFLRFEIQNE